MSPSITQVTNPLCPAWARRRGLSTLTVLLLAGLSLDSALVGLLPGRRRHPPTAPGQHDARHDHQPQPSAWIIG